MNLRCPVTAFARHMGRSGDLGRGSFSLLRGVEGIQAHRRSRENRGEHYRAEVSVFTQWSCEAGTLDIRGRIDGVEDSPERILLEEIKTVRDPQGDLPPGHSVHRLQLLTYAWIWWREEQTLPALCLRYVYPEPGVPDRVVDWHPTLEELRNEVEEKLGYYAALLRERRQHIESRNRRLSVLPFPFSELRPGQAEVMEAAEDSFQSGGHLLLNAPTGMGKTLGALTPALRTMGRGQIDRLFLVTCRNTGKRIFEDALRQLYSAEEQPLRALTLSARDRVCPCGSTPGACETCPLAKGFYDRLEAGLRDLRREPFWFADNWRRVAEAHTLCPFGLMAAAAPEADVLIGDLNFLLDPSSRLESVLRDEPEKLGVIVDEAHHLPERARMMLSGDVDGNLLSAVLRRTAPGELKQALQRVNRERRRLVRELEEAEDEPDTGGMAAACFRALEGFDRWVDPASLSPEASDLRRQLHGFQQSLNVRGPSHVLLSDGPTLRNLCLDASDWLEENWRRLGPACFQSATLRPLDLFARAAGTLPAARRLELTLPRAPDQFPVGIEDRIPLVWKARGEDMFRKLAACLETTLRSWATHTLVYFPSYALMEEIAGRLPASDLWFGSLLVQPRGLQEEDADVFLRPFRETAGPVTGLAVLGGALNEGIDLPGDALNAVIVVSIGLPGICPERERLRAWHVQQGEDGFLHAYSWPGLIRVQQALGRVIRGPEDRGRALLIDPRFKHPFYKTWLNL